MTHEKDQGMGRRSRNCWLICALLVPLLVAHPRLQSPSLTSQVHAAAGKGDIAAVAALLARGVDVDAANDRGVTPLYIAAQHGYLELVKFLLERGANPDAKDLEWAWTALRQSSAGAAGEDKEARAEILGLLVERGGGTEGESLVWIIMGGHFEAARTIINRGGADPSYLNLALAAAQRAQQTALAELLITAGATAPGPVDRVRAPERLKLWAGVYRSPAGKELTLGPSIREEQVMLERAGGDRFALFPLDLTTFRSYDRTVVLTRTVGPMPPREVTVRDGARADVFTRIGDAPPPQAEPRPAPIARRAVPRALALAPVARGREWPSFRGPGGSGILDGAHPPTVWDVEQSINVQWKTPIPGFSHSSPIVWGDRVFVTTAVPAIDAIVPFRHGGDANTSVDPANLTTTDDFPHSWRVYALDKQTGRILWERVAHEGVPRTGRHVAESQANQTPATDGTHLVVWFGSEGLYCYDLDGTLLWKKDLGPLNSGYLVDPSFEWNTASSPIIYKNFVILQVDLLERSFIAAFDITTGTEVWRTERDEFPSWATPLLYEGPPRTELVTVAPLFARGYDPDTGKELWRLGKHSIYATPTPIAGRGLIFLTTGSGGNVQPIYAVRPGATGDITLGDDEASNDYVVWSTHRGGSFTPTPILYGDLLYVCSASGILAAYEPETGERVYRARVTQGGNYTASPVAADGKLYFASEDGEVIVVKAGRPFERLAVNPMGEVIMATPAISEGMILVRMQHHVVAVAESTPTQ